MHGSTMICYPLNNKCIIEKKRHSFSCSACLLWFMWGNIQTLFFSTYDLIGRSPWMIVYLTMSSAISFAYNINVGWCQEGGGVVPFEQYGIASSKLFFDSPIVWYWRLDEYVWWLYCKSFVRFLKNIIYIRKLYHSIQYFWLLLKHANKPSFIHEWILTFFINFSVWMFWNCKFVNN